MAYKVSNACVNPTPVIFVSDSVDGSVDSGMSDIMVESDYCVNFSRKWYLQVFHTAVFLAETLNRMNDNFKTILKDIRSGQNLHQFVVLKVNPLALPDKILLLVAIVLDLWWNNIRQEVSTNCFIFICIHNERLTKCQKLKCKNLERIEKVIKGREWLE